MPNYFQIPRFVTRLMRHRTWDLSFSPDSPVYLTFDDGPVPGLTDHILDILREEQVPATFFCVGNNVVKHPELFARILEEGHSVGNHTFDHLKGTETEDDVYLESVRKCDEVVPGKLFRPPYGRIKPSQLRRLRDKQVIMWSFLSFDYDARVPIDRILSAARRNIGPGSIVVLHDNLKAEARVRTLLPALIAICREKGLGFAAIGEGEGEGEAEGEGEGEGEGG